MMYSSLLEAVGYVVLPQLDAGRGREREKWREGGRVRGREGKRDLQGYTEKPSFKKPRKKKLRQDLPTSCRLTLALEFFHFSLFSVAGIIWDYKAYATRLAFKVYLY